MRSCMGISDARLPVDFYLCARYIFGDVALGWPLIQVRLLLLPLLSQLRVWDLDYFKWEKVYPLAFDRDNWGHPLFIHRVYFFLSLMQTLSDYIPFLLINKCISGLGFLFICFQSLLLIGLSWAWSYHEILFIIANNIKGRGDFLFLLMV